MINVKTLSTALILSAAIAAPVFAQDTRALQATHHGRAYDRATFRGSYNLLNRPSYTAPLTNGEERNIADFGWSGRDPSRVGGEFPYFNGGSGS